VVINKQKRGQDRAYPDLVIIAEFGAGFKGILQCCFTVAMIALRDAADQVRRIRGRISRFFPISTPLARNGTAGCSTMHIGSEEIPATRVLPIAVKVEHAALFIDMRRSPAQA
jgi:hypothetical protein